MIKEDKRDSLKPSLIVFQYHLLLCITHRDVNYKLILLHYLEYLQVILVNLWYHSVKGACKLKLIVLMTIAFALDSETSPTTDYSPLINQRGQKSAA